MRSLTIALHVAVVVLCVLTILPMWQTDKWWVRLWDFPRLQIAGLLLLVVVLITAAGDWRSPATWAGIAASLIALVWQASHFAPYVPPMPKQVSSVERCSPGRSLSLLNVNVLQDNRRYSDLLALVERTDPDILLLLETDDAWARAVEPLNRRFAHRIAEPLPNKYGLMLFSKLEMEARLLHRVKPDIPSVEARVTLGDGSEILFHGVHPEPPLPGEDSGERDAELVMVGRDVRRSGKAAIVMGDLNDVAWSRTSRLFREMAGAGDPRAGRGFYPTYHAKYPFARWPLDHLFATKHFQLLDIQRLESIGSDHFPILYRLCLTADPDTRLVPKSAPAEAEREAAEEVRNGVKERAAEQAEE